MRVRFRDYLGKERLDTGRPRMVRFLKKYDPYIWFYYSELKATSLVGVEDGLMKAYIPPLNRVFEGEFGRIVGAFI